MEQKQTMQGAAIVAVGNDMEIGKDGVMIWHVPEDLKRFKQLTLGHPVVMGRRTWESLPKRPLPGRRNIVVTRNGAYDAPGAEVFTSLGEAMDAAATDGEFFVIGGDNVYRQTIGDMRRLHITRILATDPEADSRFPEIDPQIWRLTAQSETMTSRSGVQYRYEDYERR